MRAFRVRPAAGDYDPDGAGEAFASDFDDVEDAAAAPLDESEDVESDDFESDEDLVDELDAARESVR
ncbi:hypothetical protein GCM10022382_20390 [Microbacterium invictum]